MRGEEPPGQTGPEVLGHLKFGRGGALGAGQDRGTAVTAGTEVRGGVLPGFSEEKPHTEAGR